MALRSPARVRSSTETTGTDPYTLEEPTSAGWRNFTRAVAQSDLADGDEVIYAVIDTTPDPVVMEVGRGTYNNTTKALTRDTVYQPNGSAVSWGAGTRDVIVLDPAIVAVLAQGDQAVAGVKTFTSLLRAQLGGSPVSVDGTTALVAQRAGSASDACRVSIIGGNAGFSELTAGDTDAQYRGRLVYNHTLDRWDFYAAAVAQAILDSGGLKNASGVKFDAFPSGTRLLLANNSVPSGWSIVASLADKVILTTSTASEIDDVGGSWTISGVTIGNTTLSIAQIPAHTHAIAVSPVAPGSANTWIPEIPSSGDNNPSAFTSASTGGGGSHSHSFAQDGSWRPAYYRVGVIQKA